MSHADELGSNYQRPIDGKAAKGIRRRGVNWAVLVVAFALGCTLVWICFLSWAVVRAFQTVLA
jgi:hypothetical protein